MKRIYVQNGIVFFYGNPAGYLGDGKAVIDCMFQKEELVSFVKEQFLVEPVFREGVYDRRWCQRDSGGQHRGREEA